MREVDGVKVAFVAWDLYMEGLHTPSMYSTTRDTGAQAVFLLAPDVREEDVTDDAIREMLAAVWGEE